MTMRREPRLTAMMLRVLLLAAQGATLSASHRYTVNRRGGAIVPSPAVT